MSQTKNYQKTIYACFVAYMVQAVVNNFVPLLFVTFEETYGLPLSKITALVTFNFGIQLILDATSAGFVDKIGYRASMLIANTCAAAGLVLLTILPDLTPDPFVGILIAVMIYAVGGGLMEVLVSPIVEACPTDNKEAAMSLLHSFYCWGQALRGDRKLAHPLRPLGSGTACGPSCLHKGSDCTPHPGGRDRQEL